MKSNILKAILLMFCFSTLMTYGQNQLFIHEKNDKEDLRRFMQHPSLQEKFFQNNENEFFTHEHPFLNTKTKPNTKQGNTSKANKQCLDSIVTYQNNKPYMKDIFEYDNNGNLLLWIFYEWNYETNNWRYPSKCEYTYDNNGNRTMLIHYWWNNETNNWEEGDYKYEWTYDNKGNLILEIYYCRTTCDHDSKREYEYDNNGNCTLQIYYWWDNATNNWRERFKEEYTYDNKNNLILEIYYGWNYETNNWENPFAWGYTYDNSSNRIKMIICRWNNETNNWEESKVQFEWTYDNKDNLILEIEYGYSTDPYYNIKKEYKYDNKNNLILNICYRWNDEPNNWEEGIYKYEWMYDNKGNLILEIYYWWDNETYNWREENKSESEYDLTYSITDLIFDFDDWYELLMINTMNNMITKIIFLTFPIGDSSTCSFYWSSKEIGISETTKDNSSIKVYPNPTTGELTIDNGQLKINNVEIFDIYGKLLSFHHLITSSSHHLINISHFPTGVYFVKIRTEAGEIVRKIVKE